jgi:hydrogenase maturation protease
MKTKLVLGYGNTLRSDDGFGPYVVRALRALESSRSLRLLEQPLLTVELVEELAQSELCVLLDASTTGDVGTLRVRQIKPCDVEMSVMGHALSPTQLLALTAQLTGRSPVCWLMTARAVTFELGEQLSPVVAALVPLAIERVCTLCE